VKEFGGLSKRRAAAGEAMLAFLYGSVTGDGPYVHGAGDEFAFDLSADVVLQRVEQRFRAVHAAAFVV
jgi:hypothetical protein